MVIVTGRSGKKKLAKNVLFFFLGVVFSSFIFTWLRLLKYVQSRSELLMIGCTSEEDSHDSMIITPDDKQQAVTFSGETVAEKNEEEKAVIHNSTSRVLRAEINFISQDLDQDIFHNKDVFVPVGFVHNNAWECTYSDTLEKWWENKKAFNKREEFFMELGLITFFRDYYNFTFHLEEDNANNKNTITAAVIEKQEKRSDFGKTGSIRPFHTQSRFFLPLCPIAETVEIGYEKKRWQNGIDKFTEAGNTNVLHLEQELNIDLKKVFFVNSHPYPLSEVGWENLIHSARAMIIDHSISGVLGDIYIPISSSKQACPVSINDDLPHRPKLLYSCGFVTSVKYRGLRSQLPKMFNLLKHSDIDMSAKRTEEDYDAGFLRSKFCFVIPGDTTATSQTTKAMCGGCVPIFILNDFRELPFSNVLDYDTFSLRIHIDETRRNGFAEKFYDDVHEMVSNGTYAQLRSNVKIARDFFNYHRYGSRSPYGALLLSMYQDERNEMI
jgi:hypothetical protein